MRKGDDGERKKRGEKNKKQAVAELGQTQIVDEDVVKDRS